MITLFDEEISPRLFLKLINYSTDIRERVFYWKELSDKLTEIENDLDFEGLILLKMFKDRYLSK